MPAETIPTVAPKAALVLTEEQLAIVKAEAPVVVVEAYAGASKTTTLVERAKASPGKRILYLAFNRSSKEEAIGLFPTNVKCMSGHGLGYAKFGLQYTDKLNRGLTARTLANSCPDLRVPNMTIEKVEVVWQTVTKYLNSADEEITQEHLPTDDPTLIKSGEQVFEEERAFRISPDDAVTLARKVWERMKDVNDRTTSMIDDGYLKLYQLSKPKLGGAKRFGDRWGYDEIYLDEAQDSNPVILDIVFRQVGNVNITLVGDTHQSIYGFRNAVDAMKKMKADIRLPLSMSFRFGPEVAAAVNPILAMKGEKVPLKGFSKRTSRIGEFSREQPYAAISRTNGGIIRDAIEAAEKNKKICFIGGFKSYPFGLLMDAYHMSIGRRGMVKDAEMRSYDNFGELRRKAKKAKTGQERILVDMVDQYKDRIPELIEKVGKLATDNQGEANLILSTVHKCKGFGFDRVKLAEDFFAAFDAEGKPDERLEEILKENGEELNLLYVAATRAKSGLWTNSMLDNIMAHGMKYARDKGITQVVPAKDGDKLVAGAAATAVTAKSVPVAAALAAPRADQAPEGIKLRDLGSLSIFAKDAAVDGWIVFDRMTGQQATIKQMAVDAPTIGGRVLTEREKLDLSAVCLVMQAASPSDAIATKRDVFAGLLPKEGATPNASASAYLPDSTEGEARASRL